MGCKSAQFGDFFINKETEAIKRVRKWFHVLLFWYNLILAVWLKLKLSLGRGQTVSPWPADSAGRRLVWRGSSGGSCGWAAGGWSRWAEPLLCESERWRSPAPFPSAQSETRRFLHLTSICRREKYFILLVTLKEPDCSVTYFKLLYISAVSLSVRVFLRVPR